MLADNCVPGGEVGHHCGLWDSLPLHLGALANVLTNSGSGYQFNVRKDRLHDESLHWKPQVQLHQTYSLIILWCPINMRVFHQNEICLYCLHPPLSYEGRREQGRQLSF